MQSAHSAMAPVSPIGSRGTDAWSDRRPDNNKMRRHPEDRASHWPRGLALCSTDVRPELLEPAGELAYRLSYWLQLDRSAGKDTYLFGRQYTRPPVMRGRVNQTATVECRASGNMSLVPTEALERTEAQQFLRYARVPEVVGAFEPGDHYILNDCLCA
jgi:hypothetical protein